MPGEKDQVPLNVYYYGPSVPPQLKHDYTIKRSRRPCCCRCSTCLMLTLALIIALGIAVLISWLTIRPQNFKWYVVEAELKQLDIGKGNRSLNYDLSLKMVVRNPNKRVGVYYDRVEATAFYRGDRLSWMNLAGFYQGQKNTTDIRVEFQGQHVGGLSENNIDQLKEEKKNGYINMNVKLVLRVRYKVGRIKTKHTKPDVECKLRIPLASSNGTVAGRFDSTSCDFDF